MPGPSRFAGTIVLVNSECHDEQYLVRASRYAQFVISPGVDVNSEWPNADIETLRNFIEFDAPLGSCNFGDEIAVFDATIPDDELLRDGQIPFRRRRIDTAPDASHVEPVADILLLKPEPGTWDVYGFRREEAKIAGSGAAFLFRSK